MQNKSDLTGADLAEKIASLGGVNGPNKAKIIALCDKYNLERTRHEKSNQNRVVRLDVNSVIPDNIARIRAARR